MSTNASAVLAWLWRGVVACVCAGMMSGAALAQPSPGSPGGGYSECYDACGDGVDYDPFNRPVRILFGSDGRYEFVALGPQGARAQILAIIEEVGGRVEREAGLPGIGQVSIVATFPSGAAQERARDLIAALRGSALAPNHVYHHAQSAVQALFGARAPRLYAAGMVGIGGPGGCRLPRRIDIGMIDGPVNTSHPALRGVDVVYTTLTPTGRISDASHGTGVAVLLVGESDEPGLSGFAQGARLHAVSVFAEGQDEPETGVDLIVQAIDHLVQSGVRLINMSFAGPENAALGGAVAAAGARGVVMIAAGGNNARPRVAWPAAAPEVVAVTAVDAARRLFHRANTGAEIELAAPGVDVYTARADGAGYVSGTSFAAPIVTALAAREMAVGVRSAEAVRARLRGRAEVLGGGRNAQFGWGLVQSGGC